MRQQTASWGISSELWTRAWLIFCGCNLVASDGLKQNVLLDAGQTRKGASQWYQFFHAPGTAYSRGVRQAVVMHQEEPTTHCTSTGSDDGSKDFKNT